MSIKSSYVGIAAKAFAIGLFSRCEYDVSIPYGGNQHEYNLILTKGNETVKIMVNGSQDGAWGLTQSYINDAQYHKAIDGWLNKHGDKTIYCFVQFKGVNINDLPRVYLAHPSEVANRLKESANGRGETILYECHEWAKTAFAYGTIDKIPEEWKFSIARLEQLISVR